MADQAFDLVVVGAGPGGYVAAIRAAQLGMKVACVESRKTLGGTCLNVGCIPSKALLQSSEKFVEAKGDLAEHGVAVGSVGLDLAQMMARKDKVVDGLTKGIDGLFKKYGVTRLDGMGRIGPAGTVTVARNGSGPAAVTAARTLIATGSVSTPLPGIAIDEKRVVSSTGALALESVPGHLVVIGGGYIGLEMGSVWLRLGAKVTVVEYLDTILPNMDSDVAQQMKRLLERQGMVFRTGTKVTAAKPGKSGVAVTLEPAKGGTAEEIKADIVLVSVGRVPFTDGLGLETVGVQRNNRGYITVDASFQTNVAGIYAIGDVIPGPMLAHKAMDEGAACVEMMAGHAAPLNYDAIPVVVYTAPEAASVGRTEAEIKAAGIDCKIGKVPFTANSRARANAETAGFVKIIADARTDRVLGAHIVGPDAGTMIAEVALAMEFGASTEDIARTCHAHPTLNEAVKEAALLIEGAAVHL
ncbi:MAG: dihydrolipoyl dehydrogenase [Alphaproteobacteria bacterium]|nr:dihydrolipoyl dehydrogenase [Alphaproteobacteria bacterium]